MLRITVENSWQNELFTLPTGQRTELGRFVTATDGVLDIWLKDSTCSRDQFALTEQSDGTVLVENLSTKVPVRQPSGADIAPLGQILLACPFAISAGATTVNVDAVPEPVQGSFPVTDSVASSLLAVRGPANPTRFWSQDNARPDAALSQENLIEWFSALIAVQRSAAGSENFYREIANATVDLIGLDYGLVLLVADRGWSCVAASGVDRRTATWSETVVQKTVQERLTFYGPLDDLGGVQSLAAFDAVAAAPIMNLDDSVLGIIYGARRLKAVHPESFNNGQSGVSELQAQLVQLLAACAATGLARAEQEAAAAKLRGQFEDFCSPELVRELHNNPGLLDPSKRIVTIMFCDIRGFARLCQRLSPEESSGITTEVLDRIAECILHAKGLIIDFYGDGIAAMWNAPCDQSNHARLAVNCAAKIQETMAQLRRNSRLADTQSLRLGIGIHTGGALVGNIGGSRRLKYGPRGNTVNMTSRIEGATKHLGVDILMSAETVREGQVDRREARRVGQFQLAGTDSIVELFECIGHESTQHSPDQLRDFEAILAVFESGAPGDAETRLKSYLASRGSDDEDPVAVFLMKESAHRVQNSDHEHPSHIQITAK